MSRIGREGGVLSAAALEVLRGIRQEVRESLLKGAKTLTVVPPEEVFDVNGPACVGALATAVQKLAAVS